MSKNIDGFGRWVLVMILAVLLMVGGAHPTSDFSEQNRRAGIARDMSKNISGFGRWVLVMILAVL